MVLAFRRQRPGMLLTPCRAENAPQQGRIPPQHQRRSSRETGSSAAPFPGIIKSPCGCVPFLSGPPGFLHPPVVLSRRALSIFLLAHPLRDPQSWFLSSPSLENGPLDHQGPPLWRSRRASSLSDWAPLGPKGLALVPEVTMSLSRPVFCPLKYSQSLVMPLFSTEGPPVTPLVSFYLVLLFLLFFFFFLGPHPRHTQVPRPGVKLELQLPAYGIATATPDPSCILDLCLSLW